MTNCIMTNCSRCTKKISTGEPYATEPILYRIGGVFYRWYHQTCIFKDKTMNARNGNAPYVEYNKLSAKY